MSLSPVALVPSHECPVPVFLGPQDAVLMMSHIPIRPRLSAGHFRYCSGLPLRIFCDRDLDVSTLFELHIIAMFVC